MLKISVCDDQLNELSIVNQLLSEFNASYSSIQIRTYSSSIELSQDIDVLTSTDAFLLDIVMPQMSGIELAKLIRSHNKDASIVFLTTSTDYALDAYGVEALQYLLKPVRKDDLFKTLHKCLRIAEVKESMFSIQTRSELIPVKINDIRYVEYKDHFLFFCVKNEVIKSKFYRSAFSVVINELFEHKDFTLSHRSYLVNMRHVNKMHVTSFEMDNQKHVPISSSRKIQVRHEYMNFLIKG